MPTSDHDQYKSATTVIGYDPWLAPPSRSTTDARIQRRYYFSNLSITKLPPTSSTRTIRCYNPERTFDLPPFHSSWSLRHFSSLTDHQNDPDNKRNHNVSNLVDGDDKNDDASKQTNDWSVRESDSYLTDDGNTIVEEIYEETSSDIDSTTSANTYKSSKTKSKRKLQQRKRKHDKPQIPIKSSLDVAEVEALFESIAPHVPIQRDHQAGMDAWMRLVTKNAKEKSTLVGKLTVYDQYGRKFPKWMRSRLFDLFRGNRIPMNSKKTTSSTTATSKVPPMTATTAATTANNNNNSNQSTLDHDDGITQKQRESGYAPTLNRVEFDAHVNTLMRARQMAYSNHPIQWAPPPPTSPSPAPTATDLCSEATVDIAGTNESDSNSSSTSAQQEEHNNQEYLLQQQQRHAEKSPEILRQEAEALASYLADNLPIDYHSAVMKMLREFATDDDVDSDVEKAASTEPQAKELDAVSAFNPCEDPDDQQSVGLDQSSAGIKTKLETTDGTPDQSMLVPTKTKRKKKRFRPRKKKMKFLFNRLQPIVKSHLHLVAAPLAEFFYLDTQAVEADPHVLASQEKWNSAKKRFVDSLQAIHQNLVLEGKIQVGDQVVEDVESTKEQEIEKRVDAELSTRSLKDLMAIFRDENWNQYRQPVVFEALVLHDSTKKSADAPQVDTSMLNRMVFIDNLPIDIQESEIWDYFSRCGPISEVEIFNLRPEVDPGPLNKRQLTELRKRRNPTMRFNDEKWERPRSPVYGLITFANQEACNLALDDSLRIFGMVVRRHAVRTTKASDVSKLYIEGLPPEFEYVVDAEYELSQYLKPDIYICLQLGQQMKRRPWSCEIKFPSFESAYVSYHKLKNLPMLHEHKQCKLNWFRTPWNAPLYWTRQLGFEPK